MWRRLTLDADHIEAIDREVVQVVGTAPTAVLANGFSTLIAIVQLLIYYLHKLLRVQGILYYLHLSNAGCLHIAREARRYGSFEIGIQNIVISELDLQYQHFAGQAGE